MKNLSSDVAVHCELIREGAEDWYDAVNDIRTQHQVSLSYLHHMGIIDALKYAAKSSNHPDNQSN